MKWRDWTEAVPNWVKLTIVAVLMVATMALEALCPVASPW